ncbi:MAG TPA: Uma2 family endonuclease [Thermoguttaceae bacterium]|nr:Uma2 family endonuclease [Thermoguttaceae bacterium]
MAHVSELTVDGWTAADLASRFGAIPLCRIRHDPPPGSASEGDVVEIHDREDRLYELVDGVLVEKTVGTYESYLAGFLLQILGNYVRENDLGIMLGADGMMRLAPGLVRIPDVSFVSWERLPKRKIPRDPIADLAPDLAVEVISKSNTPQEMQRKLADYFAAAVRGVWYVYPAAREVHVYTAADRRTVLTEPQTLDGGDVLPGFSLSLESLFAEPGASAAKPLQRFPQ